MVDFRRPDHICRLDWFSQAQPQTIFSTHFYNYCFLYLISVPSFCDRKNGQLCVKPMSSSALRNALIVLLHSVFSDSFNMAAFSLSSNPSWLNYKYKIIIIILKTQENNRHFIKLQCVSSSYMVGLFVYALQFPAGKLIIK